MLSETIRVDFDTIRDRCPKTSNQRLGRLQEMIHENSTNDSGDLFSFRTGWLWSHERQDINDASRRYRPCIAS
jgi:hypothetical protein